MAPTETPRVRNPQPALSRFAPLGRGGLPHAKAVLATGKSPNGDGCVGALTAQYFPPLARKGFRARRLRIGKNKIKNVAIGGKSLDDR